MEEGYYSDNLYILAGLESRDIGKLIHISKSN